MHEKKVTWLELFYDLLFVAAVSKATHVLLHVEHHLISAEHLLKYVLIFIPIWWAWVGQSVYNNRFGRDSHGQRAFMAIELFFVLIMTASLDVDFDANYVPFFVGYIGLRLLTIIQYQLSKRSETGHKRHTAHFFGTYLWLGIAVSACSLFFDSWTRYILLYAGILLDISIPLIGRHTLRKTPIHTAHLLERFALFTLILLGESVISMLAVLQSNHFTASSVVFAVLAFVLVIAIWWQYFENVERHLDKSRQTAGQTIIYGHLFIFFSLSMIAASIQLLMQNELDYPYMVVFTFGSALLYCLSVMFVFHKYKFDHLKTPNKTLALMIGLLVLLLTANLLIETSPHIILGELTLFFVWFARKTV